MDTTQTHRDGERGNVLFLILIAVALFAALSYAVTQSSRSGGGDAGSETALVASAQITQYPSSVRTSIIRMMVSKGVDVTELTFDPPADFADDLNTPALQRRGVFHPNGGGATYVSAPRDVMADDEQGTWYFNASFEVEDLGTNGADGNDIIAFLPGIKQSVCNKINSELGIASAGAVVLDAGQKTALRSNFLAAGTFPTDAQTPITSAAIFTGQPFGCFYDDPDYVYYHVLIER